MQRSGMTGLTAAAAVFALGGFVSRSTAIVAADAEPIAARAPKFRNGGARKRPVHKGSNRAKRATRRGGNPAAH